MRKNDETGDFEASTRRAYERLLAERLPTAGRTRGWPWTTREEFETLLLGHIGADGAEDDLLLSILAIDLGERLLVGDVCWTRLRACEIARDGALKKGNREMWAPCSRLPRDGNT